ncbi:glycosyltransferase family 4 protein [Rhizobium sp. RCAM05350]|nr:glycosyltransferase family 4 protein [Rhizobium sp. RCAM05350]
MHLLGELEVTNAKVGAVTKLRWLAKACLHRTTLSSAKMLEVSGKHIETLLRRLQPFDGIVLNSVQLPGAFAAAFQKHKTIYVAHNVEASSARESAATASRALERWLFSREARYLEQIEWKLTQAALAIWTFAEADRFGFGQAASSRATVLPLVTRWDQPESHADKSPEYDLALIGTWSWQPNRIGLDWFLSEVVPFLPADMSIGIAGQLPDAPAISHPGIRLLGRVPDARAFVESGAVLPLISRGGTGVQLKTVETFELGMPCVATSASLRGIEALPDNCAVSDDPVRICLPVDREGQRRCRQGNRQRLSGSVFHQAQKTRLLEMMDEGLSRFGKPGVSLGRAFPRDEARQSTTKAVSAPYGLAVHKGVQSR